MEQITRRERVWYYGSRRCDNIDEAYNRFRDDYNAATGRAASLRLDHIGQRVERIHEFGYVRPWNDEVEKEKGFGDKKIRYRMLGLTGIHYCRILGLWDMPRMDEERLERWLEWAFTKGNNILSLVGTNDKAGRTSKRLKTRYR